VDEKGFTIKNQNGQEIYKWFQYQDNPPLQPLGPLDVLSISEGTYSLIVTGGRDAQAILRFNVINVAQQTPDVTLNDSDSDGVPDQWDQCPNTPPNSLVNSQGCPGQSDIKDSDGDGVIDQWDTEPNTPPNSFVDKNGRKVVMQTTDADGDGVIDQWDTEPNTPPNSYVDKNGRKAQTQTNDTDGDGVIDVWDTEPNTPPGSFVDRNGRKGQTQLNDSDGDGVIDQWDTQPNTPPGSFVDRNGQASTTSSNQSNTTTQQQTTQQQMTTTNTSNPSAPWEVWLGRWEVVSTYTGCPAATNLTWWFEVIRQDKGYLLQVQSGQKTKIDMLSDQNLEFKILDETRTEVKLWMTSNGQCEGTVLHPRNVRECQQGRIEGQKR